MDARAVPDYGPRAITDDDNGDHGAETAYTDGPFLLLTDSGLARDARTGTGDIFMEPGRKLYAQLPPMPCSLTAAEILAILVAVLAATNASPACPHHSGPPVARFMLRARFGQGFLGLDTNKVAEALASCGAGRPAPCNMATGSQPCGGLPHITASTGTPNMDDPRRFVGIPAHHAATTVLLSKAELLFHACMILCTGPTMSKSAAAFAALTESFLSLDDLDRMLRIAADIAIPDGSVEYRVQTLPCEEPLAADEDEELERKDNQCLVRSCQASTGRMRYSKRGIAHLRHD
ncbi:hypothetical protein BC828DRAFT_409400 [Blastocladiella britannica]|nr:hypothetical protein BC828DRAFT_409400 [Blastocladiella britannica]